MICRIRPMIVFIVIGLLLMGSCFFPIYANPFKQVLILDIPRLSLTDITEQTPNLFHLMETGATGLVTTPLPDPLTLEKIYLSINSGNQVKPPSGGYSVYNVHEEVSKQRAGELYQSLTGITPPGEGAINMDLPKIIQLNGTIISETLGLFGKLLHSNRISTAVIGNADAGAEVTTKNRYAAAALMDENGAIDFAAIGPETLQQAPLFPGGFQTNPVQIASYWHKYKDKAQVIQITLGDLERLENYGVYLTEKRWAYFRQEAVRNYDSLMGELLPGIDFNNTLVILYTVLPPGIQSTPGSRLAPVLFKGQSFNPGLLYSRSTRKTGILTQHDLPVTILNYLNIHTEGYYNGYQLKSKPGDWRRMIGLQEDLMKNYNVRWPLLTGYGYLLIGLFLLMILGLIFGFQGRILRLAEWVYLFFLTFPAVFLVEAVINPLNWVAIAAWTLGLAGLIFGAAFFASKRNPVNALAIISIITVVLILVDILFNGYAELTSFLGYSAVAGARFYGIGNEYLGFLLGGYIVWVSMNFNRMNTWKAEQSAQILWISVIFITILIIHPSLGSKIGGGITALIGLGVSIYIWLGRPIRAKEILRLAAALLLMLILVGIWDSYINRNSITHFGQLISFIKYSGFKNFTEIIVRKFQLNLKLIDYSAWTKVLIGVLLVVPVLYIRPPAIFAGFFRKYPGIAKGFLGLNITALIGLLVNDSGIVTAATMFIFGAFMLLITIIEEWGIRNRN